MLEAEACAVAIVDDSGLSATGKLAAALDRAGLWAALRRVRAGRPSDRIRIVIKPELAGFAVGSPTVTDPALVEHLIDRLHDHGFTNTAIVGTSDSSALWAENRDLYALSDLLGYRYTTPSDRGYDIVDLAGALIEAVFPIESVLHGCAISRDWLDADMRIVFSKSRTDEIAGHALCLDTLIGVLPLIDKDLHYRSRRHPGDVVAALLRAAPVQFCLIDAIVAAHGAGGRRAPAAIDTQTIIAATNIVLADYVGALKMGLDPKISPTFARVLRTHPLPARYIVAGSLDCYGNWENVPSTSLHAARMRNRAEALDRLVEPWLQRVDPELFPLKHPLDARLNATLSEFFADSNTNATSQWLLTVANALLGWIDEAIRSYRTLFDKDALRRHSVPLGLDLDAIPEGVFDALVAELLRLEPITAAAPQASRELGWQYLDEAVVFRYTQTLPIDFDLFVRRVDIARTIQFMNDYLGGVLVALAHDKSGRPVRQAERNIYLPQPNYLVLYQGQAIDVSKLEVVEYDADRHRLYWKTVLSENGSATYDDGIATFERTADGTRITITGRQQFVLPAFWQVFDPDFVPGLKSRLVTHAYQIFFDRTIANFEALVEGRDIRIGRPVDEPAPPPAEQLMPLLQRISEAAMPLLRQLAGRHDQAVADAGRKTDADGFVHVTPALSDAHETAADPERWFAEITRFIDGLGQAVRRDLTLNRRVA
jgi:uncharacterized protein (DUF362 family)